MTFQQIVLVDRTGLHSWAIESLSKLTSNSIKIFDDFPKRKSEIITRIAHADAVFVSWNTPLDEEILKHCKQLKYIGMCCSLYDEASANVDIAYARSRNIEVKGIRDYGDEGVAEYILSETIRLLKGLGRRSWKAKPVELGKHKIGIVGMGATGTMVADRFNAFGADIYYHSRKQKTEAELKQYPYLPLTELLSTCEIISFHLPRNTKVLSQQDFQQLTPGKILINTSLGLPFEFAPFAEWLSNTKNYAILDGTGMGTHKDALSHFPNAICTEKVSGWTYEATVRLSEKVIENVEAYISEQEF